LLVGAKVKIRKVADFQRHRGRVAFLAPYKASRIRTALPRGHYDAPKTKPAIGYFIAFDIVAATFEFFDETSETAYKGLVHAKVLAENPVVPVGPGETRAVFIGIATRITPAKHVIETYLLLAIASPREPELQHGGGKSGAPGARSE